MIRNSVKYSRKLGTSVKQARIHEVTPRDGLQNEKVSVSLNDKMDLVRNLVASGAKSIELCSFVREDLVPQMASSKELCARLSSEKWIKVAKAASSSQPLSLSSLVPNQRGYDTFRAINVESLDKHNLKILDTVCILTSCTESHSMKNVGMTISQALAKNRDIIQAAKIDEVSVRAYASLAFGCPFEGAVDPIVVREIVEEYLTLGADFIVLADTFGNATPEEVSATMKEIFKTGVEAEKIGLHMHDANGRAGENILVGLEEFGISNFDSAVGGCGGCNFIEGAEGNIATEKLLNLLDSLQISHGIDAEKIKATNRHLQKVLQRDLKYGKDV